MVPKISLYVFTCSTFQSGIRKGNDTDQYIVTIRILNTVFEYSNSHFNWQLNLFSPYCLISKQHVSFRHSAAHCNAACRMNASPSKQTLSQPLVLCMHTHARAERERTTRQRDFGECYTTCEAFRCTFDVFGFFVYRLWQWVYVFSATTTY